VSRKRRNRSVLAQVEEYLSLALSLPTATAVGLGMGYLLDKALGTHFWYVVLMVVGIAGGFVDVIRRLTRMTRDDT
jgi:F0F1-type ATP synthase assembly protein I